MNSDFQLDSLAFKKVFDLSNDGIIIQESSGIISFWNPACESMFEMNSDDVIGTKNVEFNWQTFNQAGELIQPLDHPSMTTLRTGKPVSEEILKIVHPDDTERWVKISTSPLGKDQNDLPLRVVVIITEITDVFSLNSELEESKEKYRIVAEKTTDVIWLMNLEGKTTFVSLSIESFTGFTTHEYLQQSIDDRFTSASAIKAKKRLSQEVNHYEETGEVSVGFRRKIRLEYLCKDGRTKWGDLLITPYLNQSGILIGIHGVTRDVTREVISEQQIASQEILFNLFYQNLPNGSAIYFVKNNGKTGDDYIVKQFNQKSLEIENLELEDVVGKSLKKLRPNIDDFGLINIMREVWLTGESKYMPPTEYNDEKYSNYYENIIFKVSKNEIATIYVDVTEDVLLKEEARVKTEIINQVVEATADGIWKLDLETNIADWSDKCFIMLGYEPNEFDVNVEKWKEIIHPVDLERSFTIMNSVNDSNPYYKDEFRLKTKSGDYKWILSRGKLYSNDFIVGSNTDITEKKEAERILARNELRYRTLFKTLSEGYALYEIICNDAGKAIDYKYLDVNDAFEDLIGKSKEDIVSKRILDVFPNTDRSQIAKYGTVALEGTTLNFEEYSQDLDKYFNVIAYSPNPGYFATIIIDITKHKKNQAELFKLSQVVEQNPVSIIITNGDGLIEYVNPKFVEITGYDKHEVIGKNPNILSSGKISTSIYEELWNTVLSGDVWSGELINKRKNGQLFYELATISPIFDSGGEIVSIVGLKQDITEERKLSKAIQEQESQYKLLLQNMPDIILIHRDGQILFANNYAAKEINLEIDELIGMNIFDFVHPDSKELVHRNFELRKDGIIIPSYDMKIIVDSETRHAFMYVNDIKFKGENATMVVLHDITKRILFEKALQESETKFRKLAEKSKFAIMIYQNSKWVYSNPAGTEISGYSNEELYNMNFWNFVHPDFQGLVKARGIKRVNNEDVISSYEIKIVTKNGEEKWILITGSSIDYNGKPAGLASIADITERKNIETELEFAKIKAESSDKLKTEFLNNISHEVRTPLNGIIGFASLLAKENVEKEVRDRYFRIIQNSSDRLLRTITDYMDISLIVSNNVQVSKLNFDLVSVLDEIYNSYIELATNKGIELKFTYPRHIDILNIESDREIFNKIFSHLISNSIKFTPHGKIEFGFDLSDLGMRFYVKDSGIGIDASSVENMLTYFTKVNETGSELNEGSGLGLSIVNGLIEALGGEIKIDSQINKGTEISFCLEIKHSKKSEVKDNNNISLDSNMNSKILIAEDDDTNYLYLENLMITSGYNNLLRAKNGQEAVDFVLKDDIALVLMDIKMPVMDGLEATKIIKEKSPKIPIIATTAYAMKEEKDKIMECGFDNYISKPFMITELLEIIEGFIK